MEFPELGHRLHEMRTKRQKREGQRLEQMLTVKAAELGVSMDSLLIEKIAAQAETMMKKEQTQLGAGLDEIMAVQKIQRMFRGRNLRRQMKQQLANVDAEQRLGSDESVVAQAEELLRQMGLGGGGEGMPVRPLHAVPAATAATVVVEPTPSALMEKLEKALEMMAGMVKPTPQTSFGCPRSMSRLLVCHCSDDGLRLLQEKRIAMQMAGMEQQIDQVRQDVGKAAAKS